MLSPLTSNKLRIVRQSREVDVSDMEKILSDRPLGLKASFNRCSRGIQTSIVESINAKKNCTAGQSTSQSEAIS